MKHFLALILLAMLAAPSSHAQSPRDLLQQGIRLEEVDGDIERAIALYRRVADDRSADAQTAATALLHLGNAYEVLGRTEARAAYERILRDFGSVGEAAITARDRLAALTEVQPSRPAGPGLTSVPARLPFMEQVWEELTVSPDGRLIAGGLPPDSAGQGTFIGVQDLASGEVRVIRSFDGPKRGGDHRPIFSRDGRFVAYMRFAVGEGYSLGLYDVERGANRVLVSRPDSAPPMWTLFPLAFRRDGSSLYGMIGDRATDGSWTNRLVTVNTTSGAVDMVGEAPSPFFPVCLSADGRTVLGSEPAGGRGARAIVAMAVDSGTSTVVSIPDLDERLFGCLNSRNSIAFSSNQTGEKALWLADVMPDGSLTARRRVGALPDDIVGLGFDAQDRLFLLNRERPKALVVERQSTDWGVAGPVEPLPAGATSIGWNAEGRSFAWATANEVSIRDELTGDVRTFALPIRNRGGTWSWSARPDLLRFSSDRIETGAAGGTSFWLDATSGIRRDSLKGEHVLAELGTPDRLVVLRHPGLTSDQYLDEGCVVLLDRQEGEEHPLVCAPGLSMADAYPADDGTRLGLFIYSMDHPKGQLRIVDLQGRVQAERDGWVWHADWLPGEDAIVIGISADAANSFTRLLRMDAVTGVTEDWAGAEFAWECYSPLFMRPDGQAFSAVGKPKGSAYPIQIMEGLPSH